MNDEEMNRSIAAMTDLFSAIREVVASLAAGAVEAWQQLQRVEVRRKCAADLRRRESAARYRRRKAEKRRAKEERKNRMLLNGGGAHS